MAGFSMELVGLEEVIGELKGLSLRTEAAVVDAVKGATNDARDASLPLIPVRTGFLLDHQEVWFVGAIGAQLIWGELRNTAPYSRWVCFGHHTRSGSWVAPQDFMTAPILVGERSLMERLAAIYG
jgi:hypothetical protein